MFETHLSERLPQGCRSSMQIIAFCYTIAFHQCKFPCSKIWKLDTVYIYKNIPRISTTSVEVEKLLALQSKVSKRRHVTRVAHPKILIGAGSCLKSLLVVITLSILNVAGSKFSRNLQKISAVFLFKG